MPSVECNLAVLQARFDAAEKALALQGLEYERRLMELNHAAERAVEVLAQYGSTYITIERFERAFADWVIWRDKYSEDTAVWRRKVDDFIATNQGSKATYLAIGAAIIALVPFLLQAIKLFAG